jgi:hypothetical protein
VFPDNSYAQSDWNQHHPAHAMGPLIPPVTSIPMLLFAWGLVALLAIPSWRLLARNQRAGVLALVPIANAVALARIANKPWWWFALVPTPLAGFIATLLTIFIIVTSLP